MLNWMILVLNISAFFFLLIKQSSKHSEDLVLKQNTDFVPKIVLKLLSPSFLDDAGTEHCVPLKYREGSSRCFVCQVWEHI